MISKDRYMDELISFLTTVFGILILGIVIALLVRLQRGLLGVILSGIAVVLLVFWLKEIRSFLLNRPRGFGLLSSKKIWDRMSIDRPDMEEEIWDYDLLNVDGEMVLIAKVPGPGEDIRVNLSERELKITAGHGFKKVLAMPKKISVDDFTYKNGILQVRFKGQKSEVKRFQRKR